MRIAQPLAGQKFRSTGKGIRHTAIWCMSLLPVLFLAPRPALAQSGTTGGEWRAYGGDRGSTKYAPLDQINKSNVGRLRIAWRRPAVDAQVLARDPELRVPNNFRVTPLMVDGVLYTPNGVGLVEAIDPGTGRTIWVQELPAEREALAGDSTRGLGYWSDGDQDGGQDGADDGGEARLFVQRGDQLYALDPKTGRSIREFGQQGKTDLNYASDERGRYRWTGAPQVCRDVVIVGSSMADGYERREDHPGDVRAYDVRTGRLRWTFHVVPRAGEFGTDTWEGGSWEHSGAANLWSLISTDEQLGIAYLPLSSATSDMYGGHRPGDNLFANTLVAVRCDDGQRVWHFQTVHHDLWDYDIPAAPVLANINVGGRAIQAVVQVTKQAFAFVFDRATGDPVWPIEERAVPQSQTPGERTSPTQPFPTKPPPFDRQGLTEDDLIDFTPELRAKAVEMIKQYVTGPMFTPPSVRGSGPNDTKGTIQMPGSTGGADWQGAAFDPETGLLYVESITGPFVADILPGDPEKTNLRYMRGSRSYAPAVDGLPLVKPPYGRITAIDLNRGEIAWTAANGEGPRNHPLLQGLNLPPLGNPGRSAPLLTRTLLFLGEGDPIMVGLGRVPPGSSPAISPGGGGSKFRAYDKATGQVLWETDLPAGTTGAPMSYLFEGRQYIVVAVGGREHPGELIALALP